MRKVSFFNKKNTILMWMLVWGLLAEKSAEMNLSQLETMKEERMRQDTVPDEPVSDGESTDGDMGDESIQADAETVRIRVLLMDSAYESYGHSEVSGICDGEEFAFTPSAPELTKDRLILDGREKGIRITSIERQCGQPLYQGTLEIVKNGDAINLINEVPLETYLESVVPSEMPSSYSIEALKAQAVCARTYAWKHIEGKGVDGYQADVDDSVNYQVYGNVAPQESTTLAVRETEGLVLCRNKEPVDTYYFSTSAGITSTDEIWGAKEPSAHLKSVDCPFDRDSPWSRWSVTIPWENLTKSAEYHTGKACELKGVEIQKKSESKAVTGLTVHTDTGNFTVETEYKVREFLSPKGCMIRDKDADLTEGGALLPSAYFDMEEIPGKEIRLTGGGYGHGVGMSQNGAAQMAEEGYTFEEILAYFFKETELESSHCL